MLPENEIGVGGEAQVFSIGSGEVLKLFKTPDHPHFAGKGKRKRALREAARERLKLHQRKLLQFPTELPGGVLAPTRESLAYANQSGRRIVGYKMPYLADAVTLLELSDPDFRETSGITQDSIIRRFQTLCPTVEALHGAKIKAAAKTGKQKVLKPRPIIIGDFNPLNALSTGERITLIDADAAQFEGDKEMFWCRTFVPQYTDPKHLRAQGRELQLFKAHSEETDWYAFAVLFWECFLMAHPYFGVHTPKSGSPMGPNQRILERVTLLHPEVRYPSAGIHFQVLPDELLDFYERLLVKDERLPFPRQILESLKWSICPKCKKGHARSVCPFCVQAPMPAAVVEVSTADVTERKVFETSGVILSVELQGPSHDLRYLYYREGALYREDNSVVLDQFQLTADAKFRVHGRDTLISLKGQTYLFSPNQRPKAVSADQFRGERPVYDANTEHYFWLSEGKLMRSAEFGSEFIADVLKNQTQIWSDLVLGSAFIGRYSAGIVSF